MEMGTTFVTADDKHGFWIQDGLLELWLRLLALHIEESPDEDFYGRKIRDQWLLASQGFFGGHVPHDLEEFASVEDGKQIIRTAIASLMHELKKAPAQLHGVTLELLGAQGKTVPEGVDTWRLIEVGEAFVKLLDGLIADTATSTDFMPGCRSAASGES